jgi:hypothetical protein
MPAPSEHKTVQARILKYAQEIGWTYVPRDEAERRRRFLPHPNPLPEDGARERMEHQLMTAQIRVHDLDPEEILPQPVAEISDGTFPRPVVGDRRDRSLLACRGNEKGRRRLNV